MDVFRYFCMHTYVFLLAYGVLKDDRVVFSCSELLDLLITFKVRKASLRDIFPIYYVHISHMFKYKRNKFIGRKCTCSVLDTFVGIRSVFRILFLWCKLLGRAKRANFFFRNTFKLLALFCTPFAP